MGSVISNYEDLNPFRFCCKRSLSSSGTTGGGDTYHHPRDFGGVKPAYADVPVMRVGRTGEDGDDGGDGDGDGGGKKETLEEWALRGKTWEQWLLPGKQEGEGVRVRIVVP